MTESLPSSLDELGGGRPAVRDLELPGGVRRAGAHAAARRPAFRCCSSTRSTTSRRPYAYRDEIAARWNLNLVNLRPASRQLGLWQQDTQACCARTRSSRCSARCRTTTCGSRAAARPVTEPRRPAGDRAVRAADRERSCARSARWRVDDEGRLDLRQAHDIPLLPLYELGYTSIGCEPCTSLPVDPGNERSGRWGGQKLECGIHIQA